MPASRLWRSHKFFPRFAAARGRDAGVATTCRTDRRRPLAKMPPVTGRLVPSPRTRGEVRDEGRTEDEGGRMKDQSGGWDGSLYGSSSSFRLHPSSLGSRPHPCPLPEYGRGRSAATTGRVSLTRLSRPARNRSSGHFNVPAVSVANRHASGLSDHTRTGTRSAAMAAAWGGRGHAGRSGSAGRRRGWRGIGQRETCHRFEERGVERDAGRRAAGAEVEAWLLRRRRQHAQRWRARRTSHLRRFERAAEQRGGGGRGGVPSRRR